MKTPKRPVVSHRGTDSDNSASRCLVKNVTIHPASWNTIQKEIRKKKEFGGNLEYDPKTNSLKIIKSTIVRGEVDNVTIPHGPYEFHTHPALCHHGKCALGIPSTADIIIHLEDVNSDNLANIVFEKDGIWVMVPSTRLRGSHNQKYVDSAKKHVQKMTKMLMQLNAFNVASRYDNLAKKWIQSSRQVGIHMNFYSVLPGQDSPLLTLPVLCKHLQT